MENKNNPAAFPRPAHAAQDTGAWVYASYEQEGMSLRDYFAAKALQGALTDNNVLGAALFGTDNPERNDKFTREIAALSYKLADAMLAERSK